MNHQAVYISLQTQPGSEQMKKNNHSSYKQHSQPLFMESGKPWLFQKIASSNAPKS